GLVIGRVDLANRRFVGSWRKAGAADAAPGGGRRRRLHRGTAAGHRSQPCRTRGPRRAGVLACAAVLFVILRHLERVGLRRRMHHLSKDRESALELRISLAILFALAALAMRMHVSIMLAGFSFGLAVAGVGEPRGLAHPLFPGTEGFLGPLFFVWLGASLDLRELGRHPSLSCSGSCSASVRPQPMPRCGA